MTSLVIDSSVALKWVVEEEGTRAALALRRRTLVAPDLLIAECANALWKKVRRNEISAEVAAVAARVIANAEIELSPMRPYLEAATQIAVTLDHPAYDCIYIALAEARGLRFVTGDESLLRKLSQPASARYRDRAIRLADAANIFGRT